MQHASRTQIRRPIAVFPIRGSSQLVSIEDAETVVRAALPRWHTFKLSRVLHAFETWGPHAVFPEPMMFDGDATPFSGSDLTATLLDHREYRRLAFSTDPLLVSTLHGVRVSLEPGTIANFAGATGHVDDLLRAWAAHGLALETPIVTANGRATIADMLRYSIASFDLEQELEWTVEAYARYLAPQAEWTNRFGDPSTFDQCVERLVRRDLGTGACMGTHCLYALVVLLRIDETMAILSPDSRRRIKERLHDASGRLSENQDTDGSWGRQWAVRSGTDGESIWSLLTSTGHHLEWIAMTPEDLRPPPACLARAVQRLAAIAGTMTSYEVTDYYLPLAHAARAVCLLHGSDPRCFLNDKARSADESSQ